MNNRDRGVYLIACFLLSLSIIRAEELTPNEQVEAIVTKTSNGYKRQLESDGSFRAETYRFGKGEYWSGELDDSSVDKLNVDDIARLIAPFLSRQNYVSANTMKPADLYIVISWGTTVAPEYRALDLEVNLVIDLQMRAMGGPARTRAAGSHTMEMDENVNGLQKGILDGSLNTWNLNGNTPLEAISSAAGKPGSHFFSSSILGAENNMWAKISSQNAEMLGYEHLFDADLQRYRYFVVLQAYENKSVGTKRPKLLWEARLSISEHHNLFDKALPGLLQNAADYLGQDSHGMIHRDIQQGNVEIGEMTSLEFPKPRIATISEDGVHVAYLGVREGKRGLAIVPLNPSDGGYFAELPDQASSVGVEWLDSQHAGIVLPSGELLQFSLTTKSWSAQEYRPGHGDSVSAPIPDYIKADMETRFPHRSVQVLGTDALRDRYLLAVSDGDNDTLYYVFERDVGLVVYVGRREMIHGRN